MTARTLPRLPRPLLTLLAAVLLLAGAGCGVTARPGPVTVEPADPAADSAPSEVVGLPRTRLRPVEPPTPRPWLPVGIRWSPSEPHEGEAVALALAHPVTGRRPSDVEATVGGRPVPVLPTPWGWFGIAPLPIGEAGAVDVELRFRLSADSVVVQRATIPVAEHSYPATTLSVAPGYSDPSPAALRRIREERQEIRATLARVTPEWMPRGAFLRPREGRVTSPFGQRRLFNGELQSRHTGLDLAGSPGEPVRAAARGRVALTGSFYFAGNAVFVDHGLGVFTGYFHLSEIGAREGETVEAGARLGAVGATGRVTGPHLHWSLYVNGVALDAGSLLRMRPLWEEIGVR